MSKYLREVLLAGIAVLLMLNFQQIFARNFNDDEPNKKIFAYVNAGRGSITASQLRGVTHVLPSCIKFTAYQNGMTNVNSFYCEDQNNMNSIIQVAKSNNKKIILSIGSNKMYFALVAQSAWSRLWFAKNLRSYLSGKNWMDKIDGFDIDWEYPDVNQKGLFNQLIDALQTEFNDPNFLWSFAVAGVEVTGSGCDWDYSYLKTKMNFCNLMGYDIYYNGTNRAPHHIVVKQLNRIVQAGFSSSKIIALQPFYFGNILVTGKNFMFTKVNIFICSLLKFYYIS